MQNHIEKRAVDFQVAIVADQAQFTEPVHEKAYAGSRRADNVREHFMAELGNHRLRPAFLAELRKDEKKPSQALLAGIEQLIDQVCLDPDVARQEMCHESLGKPLLVVKKANHGRLFQPHDPAVLHCRGCRHAPGLPSQASLAAEIAGSKDCNDCFFPLLGQHGELHLALLDIENRICRLALRKDDLAVLIREYRFFPGYIGEEALQVEWGFSVLCHAGPAAP